MAITDNKIINGSGLSELSSQIKSYVNSKIVDEVYVGDTAPPDPKAKLWVDTSAEPSNNSYTKSEIDTKLTQKQDTLTPGDNITIVNGVISSTASGSAEPDAYIKDASVSGNTLTLTKKDNTEVVFTPSGGSSGGGSDGLKILFDSNIEREVAVLQNSAYIGKVVYDSDKDNQYLVLKDQTCGEIKVKKDISPTSLLGSQSDFNRNKNWVLQWINNKSYDVTVEGRPIIGTSKIGSTFYYYWMDNQDIITQGYINFKDSTFHELADYNNQQKYNSVSTTLITESNWQNYITVSSGSDWQYRQDQYDSNLYNAKELVVYVENIQGNKQMGYFNFGDSNLGNHNSENFYFDYDISSPYIYYTGSSLSYGNANNLFYFCYKT